MVETMVPKEQVLEERVGALEKKVGDGFARVDTDIRELRGDVKKLDEKLTGKIDEQGKELRGSITALQYELVVVCLVIIGAIAGSAIVF